MPTRDEMLELVEAHAKLDDPMETAIWIRQEDPSIAWLVEVIPSMGSDDHPERPIVFTAARDFRYPLHLIGVNRADIEKALRKDLTLARAVAAGDVLYGDDAGAALVALARGLLSHGNARAS